MIERGNHKFALSDEQRLHVTKIVQQDIELGHTIPIPVECIKNITSRAEVYPIGYQDQLTINERGKIIPKNRVTHDLSYNRREGQSVNQCVRKAEMPEVIFGFALLRYLSLIHHIRWLFPNEQIICNKIDVEKAY